MKLKDRDKQAIWHPFTPFSDIAENVAIVKAKGALLTAEDGKTYIDAVSSWWVSVHGHSHPAIIAAAARQMRKLDHVIFAGFTHEPAVALAEKLLSKLPGEYDKVFYSDNGSTSVEVGIKMALQFWWNEGAPRKKIIAFRHAYHGDTFGAMAVGERGGFNRPFEPLLFDVEFVDVPTESNYHLVNQDFKRIISTGDVAAFIFEPLVLGSGGMLMYKPGMLDELLQICKENNVLTIADEVMTGFYRTGTMFACGQLKHQPDIICLSKGLSGGILPLGATACNKKIVEAFMSADKSKALYHGHSYTGNPITCASALAGLQLFENTVYVDNIRKINVLHHKFKMRLEKINVVANVRICGVILAFDVLTNEPTSYFNSLRDRLYSACLEKGVLLRPLGNTVYIMPPYVITSAQLKKVYRAMEQVLAKLQAES